MDETNAQALLRDIIADPDPNSSNVGDLTNRLLREFHRGYPLENLRPLLHSDNERLVNTGIWIASELGEKGHSLLNDVSALLKHPIKRVRYFALDCILLWAKGSNKSELASAVALLDDNESAVRWKAMDFLSHASDEQLRAALEYLNSAEPDSMHVSGLRWLLGSSGTDPNEAILMLHSQDRTLRKYGAISAARIARDNKEPLLRSLSINDRDIRQFAERVMNVTQI